MIKGAIFDMDGTLLDSMFVWENLTNHCIEPYDVMMTAEDECNVEGLTQYEVAEYAVRKYPSIPITAQELSEKMDALIDVRYAEVSYLKPGVLDLLKELQKQKIPCAVATLTDRAHAEFALKKHHILKFFDMILTVEDVQKNKYHPDIYLAASQHWGVESSSCIVFEDAPYAVETAKKAGFLTCGICDLAYQKWEKTLYRHSDRVVRTHYQEIWDFIFS